MKKSSLLTSHSLFLRSRAFTIIELLVVIAIIALLTGIVMTCLVGSKAKARDAKRVSDLGNIQLALELYYDRCKEYPGTLETTANNGCTGNITLGSFISVIPQPPSPSDLNYYLYETDLCGTGCYDKYVLRAVLESYSPALQDDIDVEPDSWIGYEFQYNANQCLDTGGPEENQYCLISN